MKVSLVTAMTVGMLTARSHKHSPHRVSWVDYNDVARIALALQKNTPDMPKFDIALAQNWRETVSTQTPSKPLVPTRYVTEIGRSLSGEPIAVGWDFCRCGQNVVNCQCVGGPYEPRYITAMREREAQLSVEAARTAVGTVPEQPAVPSAAQPVEEGERCERCNKVVDEFNGDRNDDGTWTCHACQEEESNG